MDRPRQVQVLTGLTGAGVLVMAVAAASTPASTPVADREIAARLESFVAAGYDPLTAPVDWYRQEPVAGVERALPPIPKSVDGIAPDAVTAALAWAEAQGSTSLIVSHHGRIVLEKYWHGDGRDTRFNPQSMAKTVVALLVGVAVDRGEIGNVEDRIGKYIPALAGDPRGGITIRQMLQMASGLGQLDGGRGYALTPDNPAVRHFFGSDFLGPVLALPQVAAAGQTFDYNNGNVLILSHLLERVSGKRYADLLAERLWQPLGLGRAAVMIDRPGGNVMTSTALFSRPVDWVRIGSLIVDRGMADGQRIVSAAWIDAMRAPSPANPHYGYLLWVGDQQVGGSPVPPVLTPWQSEAFAAKDMVLLNGFGGQRVWIMPGKALVVMRSGRTWPVAWDDAKLPNLIWRGVSP